jgi:hypothetical protein
LNEAGSSIGSVDAAALRRAAETEIRRETAIDTRYNQMAQRLMTRASRAAVRAHVGDVERILDQIPREDSRLGGRRPEVVDALRMSVQAQLDAARRLRLLRDRWMIRRSLYRDYQRSVGSQLLQLVKAQPALEGIRRLEGPLPAALVALDARLRGGAERLERMQIHVDLRPMHELLVGAWRFAENAVKTRYNAAHSADVGTAWEASSAAAGALMLLSRAQQEIRQLVEPPRLQ